MAWDDYSAADLAADKPPTTSVATWLAERDDILMTLPFRVELAEQSTAAAAWAVVHSGISIYTPDFAGLGLAAGQGAFLYCQPEIYVSGGGTADYRLVIETAPITYGSEIGSITAAAYGTEVSPSKVQIPYDVANTLPEYRIHAQTTAGTVYIRNVDRLTFWWGIS